MNAEELRTKIKTRLAQLKLGPIEAAESVPGLERNFINDFLKGKKQSFSTAKQPLVARALKWSSDEMMRSPSQPARGLGQKLTLVPLLDSVTAGRLASPMSQIPVDRVPLLAFADLGRGEFFALKVEGDSVDRISPDGSIIIVDRADQILLHGKFYVFSIRGETTFKMWQSDEDTPHLAPYSTNPLNKPIFIKRNA